MTAFRPQAEPAASKTSLHELRHAWAAGIALVRLDASAETYAKAQLTISVDGEHGECGLLMDPPNLQLAACRLMAVCPLAAVGSPAEMVKLVRSGSDERIVAAAGFSPRDLELLKAWDGPSLLPLSVALGVLALEQRLGVAGVSKAARAVRDVVNEGVQLDGLLPLSFYIPHRIAVEAAAKGATMLTDAASGGGDGSGIQPSLPANSLILLVRPPV